VFESKGLCTFRHRGAAARSAERSLLKHNGRCAVVTWRGEVPDATNSALFPRTFHCDGESTILRWLHSAKILGCCSLASRKCGLARILTLLSMTARRSTRALPRVPQIWSGSQPIAARSGLAGRWRLPRDQLWSEGWPLICGEVGWYGRLLRDSGAKITGNC
jgi:hypothetical protein